MDDGVRIMEQYAARAFLCGKIGRLYTVQHTQALGKLRLHISTVQRHFFVKKKLPMLEQTFQTRAVKITNCNYRFQPYMYMYCITVDHRVISPVSSTVKKREV
jgi:hypothetical protein